ncbi:conjugative transfer signal peptidase TraF [Sphingomonas sp. UYAg733]
MADPRRAMRAKRHFRSGCAIALGLLGIAAAATIAVPPRPLLVWNASASAPVGLYLVGGADDIGKGDMVIARLAEPYRSLAAQRHYLPANVPLVKRVVAMPGDRVCADRNIILVNDEPVAARLKIDASGRAMPWWRGCVRLRRSQLLLLMTDSPASFDGRYFGVSARRDLVGRARLIWAW